ncbi:glycosyltransferase family 9 protein, partial [Bacteroidota bacterium]
MEIKKENIRKILCIKPRGIGDIVNSTILIDNLRNYFPSASIDYLVEPFATHAVEYLPEVNKVINMKNREFPLKVALRIRKEKYDLLLDTWSNPRTAQISFLSGVKYRVGFAYRGREYAYNILATSARGKSHSAEHNLEILKPLNIPVISKRVHYEIPGEIYDEGKKFIKDNFKENAKIIGIIPAGGWESKRCDAEKWVEIINALSKLYTAQFLILWGPGDEKDASYIKENTGENTVLAPETSLIEMSGLIKNCDVILANDSGPMHISAAMN